MVNTLIIAATEKELYAFVPKLPVKGVLTSVVGIGLRCIPAMEQILEKESVQRVILVGSCAGVRNKQGSLVCPEWVGYLGTSPSPILRLEPKCMPESLCGQCLQVQLMVTTPHFVTKREKLILQHKGASVVDMETFYIACLCKSRNIPLAVVKMVIDDIDHHPVTLKEYLEMETVVYQQRSKLGGLPYLPLADAR